MKITSMNNNGVPELSGMGIPEKLIELVASKFGLEVVSSSNNLSYKKLETEWRSLDANKVWDRLLNQNRAIYNAELDIYTYRP